MLCVQCCHIFLFLVPPKIKKKEKKNIIPGSILSRLSFQNVHLVCVGSRSRRFEAGYSGGEGGEPCTFSSTESSSQQEQGSTVKKVRTRILVA